MKIDAKFVGIRVREYELDVRPPHEGPRKSPLIHRNLRRSIRRIKRFCRVSICLVLYRKGLCWEMFEWSRKEMGEQYHQSHSHRTRS